MRWPTCGLTAIRERPERIGQGYRRFRCRRGTQFNERIKINKRLDIPLHQTKIPKRGRGGVP